MNEMFSLLVWCRQDRQTEAIQLRIVNVDTGKAVHLSEGSFLLRVFSLEGGSVQRCFIRHIASGREAYIQGGPHLQAFVKACLVEMPESLSESPTPGEREEMPNGPQANAMDARLETSPDVPGDSKE